MAKTQKLDKAPAPAQQSKETEGFRVKQLVTLPLWKWQDGVRKAFKITTPIILGKAVDLSARRRPDDEAPKHAAEPKMAPAHICNVVNLETGELCQIIVGTVLKGTLEESYPKESYVGKCFVSTQSKIEGKRYKAYSLAEIEDPSQDA